jgi:hypothetical protein
MKFAWRTLRVVFITILFCGFAWAQEVAPARLADLGWMAGCWERSDDAKKLLSSEQWMRPAGGVMLGLGRTITDGRATDWEYMRIEQRGDHLVFVAWPRANKDETEFKLIGSKPGESIFENLAHDFPQRVIYRLSGDRLTGRIEGKLNGKEMGIDFPFKRASCP